MSKDDGMLEVTYSRGSRKNPFEFTDDVTRLNTYWVNGDGKNKLEGLNHGDPFIIHDTAGKTHTRVFDKVDDGIVLLEPVVDDADVDRNDDQPTPEPSDVRAKIGGILSSIKHGWDDYTADVRTDDHANNDHKEFASDGRSKPARADLNADRNKISIVKRGRDIVGSFLDGIHGREYTPVKANRKGAPELIFKAIVGLLAVFGFLAVTRAVIDAFRVKR
jgi:hypothetical protein